jgi:type II secretory pathway predicted ATPase ExeA
MLHRHAAHNEAVARITWCIAERAIGVITGEVGAFSELRGRDAGAQPGRRGEDALLSALPELEVIMGCCPAGWGRSPVGAAA